MLLFISLIGMSFSSKSTVSLIIFLEVSAIYLIVSGVLGSGVFFFILLNAVLSTLLLLTLYSLSLKKYASDSCFSLLV